MAIKQGITEKELVEACLRNEPKAQEELYRRFSAVMFAICMRYGKNQENAADMLQDSFIRVFGNLKNFRFEGSFEGWMKRVAVTTCLDWNKKLKNEPYSEDIDAAVFMKSESEVHEKLEAGNLMKMLQMLPAGYRTVFNLFAIEGFSHAEISEMMGISENTSKTQLFKARKLLQGIIEKGKEN
jgi:RNA polymerase sigma-70 factor (ECF subfamily)